jgi:tellurite resistance protein
VYTSPAQLRTGTQQGPVAAALPASQGPALLNSLVIPLGIAGLGGVWQALRTTAAASAWPAEVLFGLSTAIWISLSAAYVIMRLRGSGSFTADRVHPVYGPYTAYIPVIGILDSSHYVQYFHNAARGVVIVLVVALGVLLAQLLSYWLQGNLPVKAFHPGYFLPTAAGGFVCSIGLSLSGWHEASESAFGVGLFFWLVIGTLIFSRLFTVEPLPDAVKPSLAVLLSPPATAGLAWFFISGATMNAVGYLLLGITVIMLSVQVMFFTQYRILTFTANFWAFTFPLAASANFIIRWINAERFPSWQPWTWSIAGLVTALIAAIAVATLTEKSKGSRKRIAARPDAGNSDAQT